MKPHLFCIASLLFCFLCGCAEKKKENPPAERVSINNLPGEILQMDTLVKLRDDGPPNFYLLNDTIAFLTYYRNGSLLRIFRMGERKMERYDIKGQKDRIRISDDETLNASLSYLGKAANIYYEFVVEKGVMRLDKFTRFRLGENSPQQAVKVDEDLFAGIGSYEYGLFMLCHRPSKKMTFFGDHPVRQEIYTRPLLDYLSGSIGARGDELVYVSNSFGFISSYRYQKGELVKQWEKQLTDYLYEVKPRHINFDSLHCSGFDGVYVADKYIYSLYNGYSKMMTSKRVKSILVFDHNGQPVARHYLPARVDNIRVDSKEEYLYATYVLNPENIYLVRFRLP